MLKLKRLLNYMHGEKKKYLFAIIAIGFATYFSLLVPQTVRITVDSIIGTEAMDQTSMMAKLFTRLGGKDSLINSLWVTGLIIVVLSALRGIFLFLKGKWSAEASEAIAQQLRDKLFNHIQHLKYDYHVKAETGDMIQRCTSDVDTIRRFLGVQMVEIGRAVFMITIIVILMVRMNLKLALVGTVIVPLIFIYSFFFFKKINETFKVVDETEGSLSTVLQENLSGVRVVRAFGRQAFEIDKFDEKNQAYRDEVYKLILLFAQYWSTSDVLCLFQSAAVLFVGTYWTINGTISLGTLMAFITYMGMLLWPVRQLGRILSDMSKSFVAIDRIQEILDVEVEHEKELVDEDVIEGKIQFKNVSFKYEDEERNVLSDINLTIEPGETLAILGSTGSGKSSLVHLLSRLYDPTEGEILVDGKDITTYNKKYLRRNIGMILQEPFLFAKTIKDNIGIAMNDFDMNQVKAAAQVASIDKGIEEFDKGYETMVGEKGVSLSGGQKQRVAIARRVITDSPVVIFDDSLSAVDTETDAIIRKRLKKSNSKLTTIIVSHRISTLSEADKIIVLENGKITQMGTHESLIRQEGLYQRIAKIQDSYDEEKKVV
eukprot:TRINITY_DN5080_c0_g1_i1.p1 TRINITY_DN5080_c0_g1~~TRINITY_DN5080_c0_g1_i1.p1  ORF type:complete len:600 (+),score=50.49 TRINITY_DN5080_c0_g1_i1:341-2140(+)